MPPPGLPSAGGPGPGGPNPTIAPPDSGAGPLGPPGGVDPSGGPAGPGPGSNLPPSGAPGASPVEAQGKIAMGDLHMARAMFYLHAATQTYPPGENFNHATKAYLSLAKFFKSQGANMAQGGPPPGGMPGLPGGGPPGMGAPPPGGPPMGPPPGGMPRGPGAGMMPVGAGGP